MATTCPAVVDVPVVVSTFPVGAEPIQTRLARIIDEARSAANLVRVQLAEYFSDEKNDYWNDCTAKEAGHKIKRAVGALDELANEGTNSEPDTDSDSDSDGVVGTIDIVEDDDSDDSSDDDDNDDDDENPGTDSDVSTQQSYDHTFYFLGIPICYSSRRVQRS